MTNLAIIYTTFLRNELAQQTIQSIQPSLNENTILTIGDQNEKESQILQNPNWHYTFTYPLSYDCGLSYARNYLINVAKSFNIPYVLITADSIEFTAKYDFTPFIDFLEQNKNYTMIGFELKSCPKWEFDLDLVPNQYFLMKPPARAKIAKNDIIYQPCDIFNNFCLIKTENVVNVLWDNELKLTEHEDFFWRMKLAGYESFYTNALSAKRVIYRPEEYKKMRDRTYSIYLDKLLKKYNLVTEIRYAKGATF